jgi:hypothetical protein
MARSSWLLLLIFPTAGLRDWNRKTIKKEVTFDGIIPIYPLIQLKKNVIDATKEEGETLDRGGIALIHLTGNTTDVKIWAVGTE